MARDRKRAKQRQRDRARRAPGAPAAPPSASSLEDARGEASIDPLRHASADADLAEAQVALGRTEEDEDDAALIAQEAEHDGEPYPRDAEGGEIAPDELEEASDLATTPGRNVTRADGTPVVREHHQPSGNRVVGFLQASWRELQRVQWPDRRQVAQATGVVLVFVIVTGAYLGLADEVFSRLVNALL